MKQADELRFNEDGLIPAIVQDAASKEVLTLAYMNKESYEKTLETKETWFYSRSRQALWHKGETSGNTQAVKGIRYDCDQDALIVLVEPSYPACHTGSYSCFTKEQTEEQAAGRFGIMNELERVIAERQAEMPEGAYTTYLFREGVDKILKKSEKKHPKSSSQRKTGIMRNSNGKRQTCCITCLSCSENKPCRWMMCLTY